MVHVCFPLLEGRLLLVGLLVVVALLLLMLLGLREIIGGLLLDVVERQGTLLLALGLLLLGRGWFREAQQVL